MAWLEIARSPLGGALCVALTGELDLAGAPALQHALDAAVRESDGVLFVDLTALEFIDSTGLTALLRTRALLGREERELALICPRSGVRRVFDVAGISDLFAFYATRADAERAHLPPAA
jgi:anti-sigma B factor antagonist